MVNIVILWKSLPACRSIIIIIQHILLLYKTTLGIRIYMYIYIYIYIYIYTCTFIILFHNNIIFFNFALDIPRVQ